MKRERGQEENVVLYSIEVLWGQKAVAIYITVHLVAKDRTKEQFAERQQFGYKLLSTGRQSGESVGGLGYGGG